MLRIGAAEQSGNGNLRSQQAYLTHTHIHTCNAQIRGVTENNEPYTVCVMTAVAAVMRATLQGPLLFICDSLGDKNLTLNLNLYF